MPVLHRRKNSDHAVAICAATADSAPEDPDVGYRRQGVALGEEEDADGNALPLSRNWTKRSYLQAAVARMTVNVITATARALSRNQTTTALPF